MAILRHARPDGLALPIAEADMAVRISKRLLERQQPHDAVAILVAAEMEAEHAEALAETARQRAYARQRLRRIAELRGIFG